MNMDRIKLTILEDGTARVEVEGVSGANHVKADQLVTFFARLLGGELTVKQGPKGVHSHADGTVHQH